LNLDVVGGLTETDSIFSLAIQSVSQAISEASDRGLSVHELSWISLLFNSHVSDVLVDALLIPVLIVPQLISKDWRSTIIYWVVPSNSELLAVS
jgi:hypothetical protein